MLAAKVFAWDEVITFSLFLLMLTLLALAVAPGIAIACYIYWKDKYDREPLQNLATSFLLGVACIVPAIILEETFEPKLGFYISKYSIYYYVVKAFIIVAISEEGSKFLMLRFYAFRQKAFNDPFDGITYSVMVSMGFATFENMLYVFQSGFATGLVRMFLSVPAHASFAVIMGYHVGLAKFDPKRSAQHMAKGLLLAIFFHGAFDFFLFLQDDPDVTHYVSSSLLVVGALISWWFSIRLSFKSIKLQQQYSKQILGK
jgi:RsiW-degrading membrane proteinase PrsW (M82 family)